MDLTWATQESEAVAEKVLRYRRDASGWKKCREGEYRGEGILCGTPEEVWDCIKPVAGGLREKWDDNVSHFEIVQSITDTLCVSRTSTPSAAMKLISPRDFVDLVLVKKYEDGTISSNAEPEKTNLVTFFQTDLNGYLPQSVVDSFFPRSMAEFYPNLQKAVRKFHH
ncbi:StAR-related lipid transfer protein 5 [Apodemus speciosus]|uniref:StAR-related lipid transfer protein 5 n=1 Tax=Apodemus speciosus TaxID=105296 RepID=A0ABQ0EZ40_APOSI